MDRRRPEPPAGEARVSPPSPLADNASTDEAPQAGRAYAVQLHAFPTRPAAEFAARQAGRILGVVTRVHGVATSSLPFKVLAGHFTTRAAATLLRERAVQGGFPEAWVVADPDAVPH